MFTIFHSSSLDIPGTTSMQDMGRDADSSSGTVVTAAAASTASTSSTQFTTQSFWADSDFETEPEPTEWRANIDPEELRQLNPREVKRQDVINGTEL